MGYAAVESRPHFEKSTTEIEEIYKQNIDKIEVLEELLRELKHRDKPRAIRLREEIVSILNKNNKQTGTSSVNATPRPVSVEPISSPIPPAARPKPAVDFEPKQPSDAELYIPETDCQTLKIPPGQPELPLFSLLPQPSPRSVMSTAGNPQLKKKQIHILNVIEYLSSLARVNSIVVRDIANYQNILWLSDIPRDGKNCYSKTWGADENTPADVWLEVKKISEPPLPTIPKVCEQWVDESLLRKIDSIPTLRQSIVLSKKFFDPTTGEQREEIVTEKLAEHPMVMTAWNTYIQQKWEPWKAIYKKHLEIQKVFGALFSIYQELQRLGEQYELVIALGLLTWRQPEGQSVRRHLLVAKTSLEFESAIGRFVVKPAPDGDQAEVELDMLEPQCYPTNASSLVENGRHLRDNFWDRTISNAILSAISNSLERQGRGVFQADVERASGASATDVPLIEYAPALILRKRSQKGLLNILADMRRQVENGTEIPQQFLDLCEVSDLHESVNEGDLQETGTPEHIYFPLPANEQQQQIIYKYNRNNGVLVQGPPGTGKSLTIANLICHLLATGQRVLVTAKTARALEVLQEKIPSAVSPLCISMLGSGTGERESLERSVNGILMNLNTHNDLVDTKKMEELEQTLHNNRKDMAQDQYELIALREKETFEHSLSGGTYTGTAATIAIKLKEDEPFCNWLEDKISVDDEVPLKSSEIDVLSALLLEISDEMEAEYSKYIPDTDKDIPNCEYLRSVWQQIADYELTANDSEVRLSALSGQAITRTERDKIIDLYNATSRLVAEINSVRHLQLPWVNGAIKEVLTDLGTPWKQLHKLTTECLEKVKTLALGTQSLVVQIPATMDLMRLNGDANTLLDHFSAGGGLKQYRFFEHPLVKKHGETVKQVRVNGQECLNKNLLQKLINYLKVKFMLYEIWSFWVGKADCQPGKHPLMQIAEIDELNEALDKLLGLYSTRAEVLTTIEEIIGLPHPQFENIESLNELMKTCQDALKQSVLKDLYQKVLQEEGRISAVAADTNTHPLCAELLQSFKKRDADGYSAIVNKIKAVAVQRSQVLAKHDYLDALASKAPQFAATLRKGQDKQCVVQHLKTLDKAWAWKRASDWMHKFHNQDGNVLERNIKRLEISSAKAIEELAALKAWSHCFSRMTREHQQHLVNWQQSMGRLGKATGKHAHKHRQDAQKSLNECKGAVPAWIMPLHRVYETVEASPGFFDVIIVDEASQCGYEALPLLYLAKKIIVVGDEKQISPEAVGIERSHVFNLMRTHLADLKLSASFDIENSLFAHGQIRFGNRITLCEHFRCAPEIIRFSNELCYTSNPLIPLKQVPPNRLKPLKAVHVPSGYREGSGQTVINKPEAEAIVTQIIECCQDRSYDGMTMGVIVLQGDAQAKIIEDMLVKRLGTEEMQERRLLCGNPYSFQGDERDVVFLSMVAARNQRIGTLVQEKDMRRFNVAASRSREQMWLFHSVTNNDLSNSCLRKRLLNHFYDTSVRNVAGISVEELQVAAHIADRRREQPPDPFDSWFEVDVALDIAGRGYTVVPQLEFAGKRIDLVIQEGSAQLAVECDGDHWHGWDKYEEDMQRQRMLERCKWVFFRVKESNYRIDKEKALEQLWGMLQVRGIYPKGCEQYSPIETVEIDSEPNFDNTDFACNDADISNDADEVDFDQDNEESFDDASEIIEGYPLSIRENLKLTPVELRQIIANLDQDNEESIDESSEVIEGYPVSIKEALNLKPADSRNTIQELKVGDTVKTSNGYGEIVKIDKDQYLIAMENQKAKLWERRTALVKIKK